MVNALTVLSNALVPQSRATEGAYRAGPYLLSDGWLSAAAGRYLNFWQMGYSPQPGSESSAMVEACIGAYAQTIAMCPGDHWRTLDNGGRERVKGSALTRIIKRPNDYQSISDFLMNLTRRLYGDGEAFGYAVRNDRFEISELHLMRKGRASVADDGSIFYALLGNEVAERRFDLSEPIPARDVLHVRLHTPQDELRGVSPLLAATLSRALSGAALSQQITFYLNQARPSFILETDEKLNREQTLQLREHWNAQTQGENAGGTPIAAWGLKAKPVTTNANDGQLAELLKSADQDIALAFQMPMQVLGIGDTPFASTEALMSAWKSRGLGFAINHIEEAFGLLFQLKGQPEEYLEFDTDALLRSSFKERIDALVAGTHRLYTINEARAREGLPRVDGGDEIRVQQQDVPLSYGANLKPPNPSAAPAAPPTPATKADEAGDGGNDPNVVDFTARDLLDAADEIERRAA